MGEDRALAVGQHLGAIGETLDHEVGVGWRVALADHVLMGS
jgi:hypothetical protein